MGRKKSHANNDNNNNWHFAIDSNANSQFIQCISNCEIIQIPNGKTTRGDRLECLLFSPKSFHLLLLFLLSVNCSFNQYDHKIWSKCCSIFPLLLRLLPFFVHILYNLTFKCKHVLKIKWLHWIFCFQRFSNRANHTQDNWQHTDEVVKDKQTKNYKIYITNKLTKSNFRIHLDEINIKIILCSNSSSKNENSQPP